MIKCIFTIDYEIFGNGQGALQELVYEPAARLQDLFNKWNAKFVVFVEAAELDVIDAWHADAAIGDVRRQVRDFYRQGYEIALHLHPQWCNARLEAGQWILDYEEYNLCTLSPERIAEIVDRSLAYLRQITEDSGFTPKSFRAGNWLFRPTRDVASVLAERGLGIDSSVFKGGLLRQHRLDYRRAAFNGFFWTFRDDVNIPCADGFMLEVPVFTRNVPFWKMLTCKRVGLQHKAVAKGLSQCRSWSHYLDYARFRYPMKFDFCRMTLAELKSLVDEVICLDRESPDTFKPLVAIGHTKDLVDLDAVQGLLAYLKERDIGVSTLTQIYDQCRTQLRNGAPEVS